MPGPRQSHKIYPAGVINRDVQLELVPEGDYLSAVNMRMGRPDVSGSEGMQHQVDGNVLVAREDQEKKRFGFSGTPDADCVGAFRNPANNVIYFWLRGRTAGVANQIREYDVGSDRVRTIYQSRALVFPGGSSVNTAAIIGGRFLVWTTSKAGQEFVGDAPRWVDLEDLKRSDSEFEIYVWSDDYVGEYSFIVQGLSPTNVGAFNLRYVLTRASVAAGSSRQQAVEAIRSALRDARSILLRTPVSVSNVAEQDTNPLFYATLAGRQSLSLSSDSPQGLAIVARNGYNDETAARLTDLVRWPPRYAPEASYIVSPRQAYDLVTDSPFQFRTQYVYRDGSISAWGPISSTADPANEAGLVPEGTNGIRVRFNDAGLRGTDLRSLVDKVRIAVREGTDGLFRKVADVKVSTIGRDDHYLDFFNDKAYPVVPSDGTGGTAQTQALKLFDAVPRGAVSCASIVDEDGNAILALGGCLEGGSVEDTSLSFSVSDKPASGDKAGTSGRCNITVKGRIDVFLSEAQREGKKASDPDNYYGPYLDRTPVPSRLRGFVVYLAGTDLFGVSDNFVKASASGEFEIEGVPRGLYVMRVASADVQFDDSQGETYNLSRGRDYQRTSAPVARMGGGVRPYERIIDLRQFEGNVFDLMEAPGYGAIVVETPYSYDPDYTTGFADAYVRDNSGSEDKALADCIGVPDHTVLLRQNFFEVQEGGDLDGSIDEVEVDLYSRTDHNGYVFWFLISGTGRRGPSIPQDSAKYLPVTDPCDDGDSAIELVDLDNSGYVEDATFRERFGFTVTGTVINPGGGGVDAVGVVAVGALAVQTNAEGAYSIQTFLRSFSTSRNIYDKEQVLSYIVPHNTSDRCYAFPFTPEIYTGLTIDVCAERLLRADFTTEFVSGGAPLRPVIFGKSGGRYRSGIVYEDRANRKGEVLEGPEIYIPFHTEDNLGYVKRYVNFAITGRPPYWATHYRLLRSRNGVQSSFVQRLVSEVRYVEIGGSLEAPETRAFGQSTVTHIMLRLDGQDRLTELDTQGNTDLVVFFDNPADEAGLTGRSGRRGDRIRLIATSEGDVVLSNGILETEVVGEYVDPDDAKKYFIVVEAEAFESVEVLQGMLLETYTPHRNRAEDDFLFETADAYPIVDAGTPQRRHGGLTQDQSTDGATPARGYLTGGDTYWRRRLSPTSGSNLSYVFVIENPTTSDRFNGRLSDTNIGRPNPVPGLKERFYYWMIRTSNTYLQSGSLIGVNSFSSGDRQNLDPNFGPITKLLMVGQRMVVVHQFKIQPIYVAHEAVMDMTGNSLIGRTDRLLNVAPETTTQYGSRHPDSIQQAGSYVMAYDAERGIVWRYGQNGAQNVSRGLQSTFHDAESVRTHQITATYDPTYGEYLLSFADVAAQRGQVYAFRGQREDRQGWTSQYVFYADRMIDGARDYFAVRDGAIHRHNVVGSRTFFGQPITAYLTLITSMEVAGMDKVLHQVRAAASATKDFRFGAVKVRQQGVRQGGFVQASKIPAGEFVRRGAVLEAPFLRQQNGKLRREAGDLRRALYEGPKLFGNTVILRVEGEDLSVLFIDITYSPVGDTKP